MAMTLPDDDTLSDINITPFTDVLLVLLIIFMVTATSAVQTGFKVDLPTSVTREEAEQSRTVVTVGPQGQLSLGERTMTKEALRASLSRLPAQRRAQGLVVMADRKASYAQLVDVMDVARQSGFTAIGLATQGR